MSRRKNISITLGSLAAGAVLATGVTGIALAADSPSGSSSSTSSALSSSGPSADQPGGGAASDGRHGPRDGGRGPGGPGAGMLGAPGTQPLHGEMVVQAADGTVSTVQMVRGTVTAVSTTSITVKASDGFSATFAIGSATEVRTGLPDRNHGPDAAADATGSIADVSVGDVADVHGTVSGATVTATGIHAMTAAQAEQAKADHLAG